DRSAPLHAGANGLRYVASVKSSRISKDSSAHTDARRDDWQRKLRFHGGIEIGLAAEMIVPIIRPDAVIIEATDDAVRTVEMVEYSKIPIISLDTTATYGDQREEIQPFRQGLVIVAARRQLDEFRIPATAGHFRREIRI